MRVLGHVHTFNDDDVLDRSLHALLGQTRPLDHVIIVDNGSTDRTLARVFPPNVTVLRHSTNLGTSGAVITGFEYALTHGYDWIWIFDADSAPHPEALDKLLALYQGFPIGLQRQIRLLASLPVDVASRLPYHAIRFDSKGFHPVVPESGQDSYEFDAAMWTGCLFYVPAIRHIGLPSPDWVLDWGEFEYGYLGHLAGLKAYLRQSSIVSHNIRGRTSIEVTRHRLGPIQLPFVDFPAIRCYYRIRNTVYFWLYEYRRLCIVRILRTLAKAALLTLNFVSRPRTRRMETAACLRGLWDGLRGRLSRRY
jgi:GT2 family glycosyltransferase